MTSLPIVWPEQADIGAMLQGPQPPPHWAKAALEARGILVPLDRMAADTLGGVGLAVLIQPRALSPDEFAALDRWVRKGGRLLLFADPMLDVHSSFPLGDKRRPQAIVMVDPLLAHWGLELEYDEAQSGDERTVVVDGIAVPVKLPGTLRVSGKGCRSSGERLVAACRIGKGRAVIVADADLFEEPADSAQGPRVSALNGLLQLVDNLP
jgi:hypothetical protein